MHVSGYHANVKSNIHSSFWRSFCLFGAEQTANSGFLEAFRLNERSAVRAVRVNQKVKKPKQLTTKPLEYKALYTITLTFHM